MQTETNIFEIQGLPRLSVSYKVYKIVGLQPGAQGYYGNLQTLVNRLSRILRAPVTTIDREDTVLLATPSQAEEPPTLALTGAAAKFVSTEEVLEIRFDGSSPEYDGIRQRFLQFAIQGPLRAADGLWQPRSGQAFFGRKPESTIDGVDIYRGANVRIVKLGQASWGVSVDVKSKFVRKSPLSELRNEGAIKKLKNRSCLYRMGHNWFEVSLDGYADYNISDEVVPDGDDVVSLLEYVVRRCRKPVPKNVADLAPDGKAVFYRTEGPGQKSAPAGLCYLIEESGSKVGKRLQRHSILAPRIRQKRALQFVSKYLQNFVLSNVELSLAEESIAVSATPFPVPNHEFGNEVIEGFDSSLGAANVAPLSKLGPRRMELLSDRTAGFFSSSPLGRQYLILPRSIATSSGSKFKNDLMRTVLDLYPDGKQYDPEVIEYDDLSVRRNFIEQGRAIKEALGRQSLMAGHALVMIHEVAKNARSEDQLEAMIVKDLPQEFGLKASVIHTDTVRSTYKYSDRHEMPNYYVPEKLRGRFRGYLRNVALSKVLLSSGKIPFVLAAPADNRVFVGIDVKRNTAAFALVGFGGRLTRCETWNSRQRERLTADQAQNYLSTLLESEAEHLSGDSLEIVVHRDGRVFESEIEGLKNACEALAEQGTIPSAWTLDVLEIKKTSPVSIRMFSSTISRGERSVIDPQIGSWISLGPKEGFVATTGVPFRRPGTANPLHVVSKYGELLIEDCLKDVFELATLSWTSPANGSRVPLTIKFCDRVLFEDAADYDVDLFENTPLERGTKHE
ncbi:MAG: Piwi domain-containing protein [Pseudomonadota bacterium]